MEKRFINRDFEQYLKKNTDQYRMFPSERVWDNIHQRLHSRRRWYAIGLALLLISTAVLTSLFLLPSGRRTPEVLVQESPARNQPQVITTPASPTRPVSSPVRKPVSRRNSVGEHLFPALPSVEAGTAAETTPAMPLLNETAAGSSSSATLTLNPIPEPSPGKVVASAKKPVTGPENRSSRPSALPVVTVAETAPAVPVPVSEKPAAVPLAMSQEQTIRTAPANLLTIESVLQSYRHVKPRKRLAWQVYATPTITYRKLKENKAFLTQARQAFNMPNSISFADINNMVTHKPDIGIQVGVGAAYPLSRRLRITTGLQFNVSKYDIRAYTHTSEVATIALTTNYGGTNSVSTITNYRNIGGYRADWLHNLYISASAPVGLELNLARPGRAEFGIQGTLQPTYVLGNRAYLLSADFKNYAEVPSLTRKWNLNTGLEVFAGYNTKRMSWRIGPQVRYQVFSSFVKQYPISEHLFDFGIKLGVTVK